MRKNYHTRVEGSKVGRPEKKDEPPTLLEPEVAYVQVLGIRCPGCGRAIIPKAVYTWDTFEGKRTSYSCNQCGKRFVLQTGTDGKTVIRLR